MKLLKLPALHTLLDFDSTQLLAMVAELKIHLYNLTDPNRSNKALIGSVITGLLQTF